MPEFLVKKLMAPIAVFLCGSAFVVQAQDEEEALEPPRMFSDPAMAVQTARQQEKLMFFTLIDIANSRELVSLLNDNYLKLKKDEFLIVLCDSGNAAHRGMFAETFKQDVTQLPLVTIANPSGEVLASIGGTQPQEAYDITVHEALIKAEKRTEEDPIISSATGEILEGSSEIFRILKEEVMDGAVRLTPFRTWTRIDGETFEAALLKAEGAEGVFVLESDESEIRVNFNNLVPADHEVIGAALSGD